MWHYPDPISKHPLIIPPDLPSPITKSPQQSLRIPSQSPPDSPPLRTLHTLSIQSQPRARTPTPTPRAPRPPQIGPPSTLPTHPPLEINSHHPPPPPPP